MENVFPRSVVATLEIIYQTQIRPLFVFYVFKNGEIRLLLIVCVTFFLKESWYWSCQTGFLKTLPSGPLTAAVLGNRGGSWQGRGRNVGQTVNFYSGHNNEGSRKHTETLTSYYCPGRQRLIQMRLPSEIQNLTGQKKKRFPICFFLLFFSGCTPKSLRALHLSVDINERRKRRRSRSFSYFMESQSEWWSFQLR